MRKWFNNLKVAQKLMLISIFFVMPDSLMLYLFITGINENIHFAQMEKKGNEYQRPLEELLELIPQHRLLAEHWLRGEAQVQAQLAGKQAQIEAAFNTLQLVDARIGADLQFTQEGLAKRNREHCRVGIVRQEWEDLKNGLAQLQPDAVAAQHTHLRRDIRTMITHAGDLSNLILDPDLDSYYLMDATLLALPNTQDRLTTVMFEGEAIARRQTISNPERQRLAVHARLLKEADLDRINASVQTALNEDGNFYDSSPTLQTRVPLALNDYRTDAEAFIQLTTRLVASEKMDVTATEYLAAGNKAREASFRLWKIADEELDVLLQKRIEAYELRRAKSLCVSALALLAAVCFVAFITRSISGPLHQQAAALQSANEKMQGEIAERFRAEAELRGSQAQLAAAQKIARIGSWEQDVSARTLSWSDENYRIHGLARGDFNATYDAALNLIHPEDRRRSDAAFKRALHEGQAFSFEQRVIRSDGTERIIHQRGDVVRSSAGRPLKIFGTAEDITERKLAEQELEKVHKQLLDTSRQAGMAEVATGVLHNVGNVLNSVNVASTCVSESLRKSKVANLGKAVAMLREHQADLGTFINNDPKGKQLPGYLTQLAEHLANDQAAAIQELAGLQKNIEHIKDIVATQQSFAKVSGVTEAVKVNELIEDALRMNSSSLCRHDIHVFKEFNGVPVITVEKHKVLQILVNLVRNAKQACDGAAPSEKRLTLRVTNDPERVRISVGDNGCGILPENLERIFGHGFTTKKDGHGFGLHSGALSAREMGGALSVTSEGAGKGATFTLELPVSPLAVVSALTT